MRPSLAGRSLPPSGLEVSYPQAADGDDSLERVRAMILLIREKLCLYVGLAADDERLEQIREMFVERGALIAADSDNLSAYARRLPTRMLHF